MSFLYLAIVSISVIGLMIFAYLEFFASAEKRRFFNKKFAAIGLFGNDKYISLKTFAECEHHLAGVSRVVVVCEQIERPTSKLATAVMENFAQGIKYQFFVASESVSRAAIAEYYDWFKALFDASEAFRDERHSDYKFDDLFSVRIISAKWHTSPYVFHISDLDGKELVTTYRGLNLRTGISNFYERVSLQEAMSIISICAAASQDFRTLVPLEASPGGENVVSLQPRKSA